MLIKIFAYVSFVIVLLSDADKHGTVALLCFFHNFVFGVPPVHGGLIAGNLLVIELELVLAGQDAILLLRKHQSLLDARCFDTLHLVHLFRRLPGESRVWPVMLECRVDFKVR